ncbi:MAG TPA: helix-hairpin-helix domain-containing protein [Smithellaceae bacterium]|nr:helix-hairpin-helix domain-containing protein [Smithellaceae bacterium]
MAVIPLFCFFYTFNFGYHVPDHLDEHHGAQPIEIVTRDGRGEIYFFADGTSAREFWAQVGYSIEQMPDYPLRAGMKIIVNGKYPGESVAFSQMDASKKLALGLPLDINKATKEDLILISGIGEATAEKIITLRAQLGGFTKLEDLMKIKGIKEKRLSKFRNYLYVEQGRQ